MTAASAPSAAIIASQVKRRRKNPLGKGESSREASEESNGEEDSRAGSKAHGGSNEDDETDDVQSIIAAPGIIGQGQGGSLAHPQTERLAESASMEVQSSSSSIGIAPATSAVPPPATESTHFAGHVPQHTEMQADSAELTGRTTTMSKAALGRARGTQVGGAKPDASHVITDDDSSASTYDGDISSTTASTSRVSRTHGTHHGHVHGQISRNAGVYGHAHNNSSLSDIGGPSARMALAASATPPAQLSNLPTRSAIASPGSNKKQAAPSLPYAPDHALLQQHRETSDVIPTDPSSSSGSANLDDGQEDSLQRLAQQNVARYEAAQASAHPPAPHGFLGRITAEDMQKHMADAISGLSSSSVHRTYKINLPPQDRKAIFPQVHLLVGVCADELVLKHKAQPVLTSAERYESVRNCKWVDEVIEDAPWVIDQAFLDHHGIDYVAHDEEPYASSDSATKDIYSFVKDQGKFLPTRRTQGVSTSELLQRIVEGYREGAYDGKLIKIGHPELSSRAVSETGSRRSRDQAETHHSGERLQVNDIVMAD
ncbi:hypothetical protein E5Q_00379 [Mixia osmundae IAM 14324]|uniref:choline-phosphate cytidylyltransferase n=1 Tax=Mixia osmundae (strain CBS 9802 / IAM 14324 / JCM 22182 / KY 12970) TaxID=764103 RepID=G7DT86_MIXOS|nr:hypothetical protein E5Q_00379 [Mixia osmundae IAM 14324]